MSRAARRPDVPDERPPAADPSGAPAPARPSSTVVLLRPGPAGFETFMLRRDAGSRFAADMSVFPGGALHPNDADPELIRRSGGFGPDEAFGALVGRGSEAPASPAAAFGLHIAALRELFEEAGVLLGTGRRARGGTGGTVGGRPSDATVQDATAQDATPPIATLMDAALTATALADGRARLQQGTLGFAEFARSLDLELEPRRLVYLAHWITPTVLPRRFDTRFFLAELPDGQEAAHCGVETTEGEWMRPDDALARAGAGTINLMQPTEAVLRSLAALASVGEAIDWARRKRVRSVHPTRDADGWSLNVEGDAW